MDREIAHQSCASAIDAADQSNAAMSATENFVLTER